ncbi:hypothetical protein OF83DRAFT_309606 [Amylostereum chailletii]|nr:hypothetical protein OF83DRAFT_309606 [Amylostereum chailletii]
MQSDAIVILNDGPLRYGCGWVSPSGENCGKAFKRKGDWARHNRVHLDEKPYACSVCGRGFTQKNACRIHMNSHTGDTPYTCAFDECTLSFSDPSSRSRHHREQHSPSGGHKFMCPVPGCRSRGIKRRTAFVAHLKRHGVDPRTILGPCVRSTYRSSSALPTSEPMIQVTSAPVEVTASNDVGALSLDPRILLNGHASTSPQSFATSYSYDQPHADPYTVYERTISPCTGYTEPTIHDPTPTPPMIASIYDRTPSPFNFLDPLAISLSAPPTLNLLSASFLPSSLGHGNNIDLSSSPATYCSSLHSLSPSPIPLTPPSLNVGSDLVDFATSDAWFQQNVWGAPLSFEKPLDFVSP